MIITRQLLREWQACYSDKKLAATVPESGLTPLQTLDLDIPGEDRLWVVLRESVIPARDLRLLACKWAREALVVDGNPDPRSVAAVDCSERFAKGEATADELAAACYAAGAAASAAACSAARDAARAAARDAARDAASAAAWAAASAAASAAAGAAAWAAARDAQIADCRSALIAMLQTSISHDQMPAGESSRLKVGL